LVSGCLAVRDQRHCWPLANLRRSEMAAREIAERITADPDVMVGKPVVKGTRIPVELVLSYLADTPDFAELFADYPELTMADVQACLQYAKAKVHTSGPRKTTSTMAEAQRAAP
jgi:uncharacterized protein (DUF433 family)